MNGWTFKYKTPKPFDFGELLARLRALIRRGRQPLLPEQFTVGPVVLDTRGRRVRVRNRPVLLTAKEYALLECFMRHPNQVLSRTILSEKVWDENFDAFTNVIDVYVNYLRNKIDRDFEPKLIQTIRGAGYVMRAS